MGDPKPLPRTTHLLKHDQRVRLMRSTRKVEHILGETPLFIDPSSPSTSTFPVAASRRAALIYVATPRSSSLGVYTPPEDRAHASSSHIPARPVLSLRVPDPECVEPPLSPASFSLPIHPTSPEDEQRRHRTRKMARVVRTLGENVPAELVFPTISNSQRRSRRSSIQSRRRSARLVRAPSTTAAVPTAAARAGLPDVLEWEGERERERERETAAAAAEQPALASPASDVDSESVYSTLSGGDWEQTSGPPPGLDPPPTIGYDRGTHRTEKGWSGEWVSAARGIQGMQNMDEVAARLRGLRLK
ncbi:hypothetical protein C8F04DRAFT_1102014 [Mycena alexandri]|uniref:Uncharacterized protein n=1 Tax=Mycena alexandri TaxID=1745969 RepID=A0AAD6SVJ9_9AGAR|nr:hypothetical protein C8F04DRAFT_1102014 [Mycena alexandri]